MRNRTLLALALTAFSGAALAQPDTLPDSQTPAPPAVAAPQPPAAPQIPEAAAANPVPDKGTTVVTTTVTSPTGTVITAPAGTAVPGTTSLDVDKDKGLKTASVADVAVRFVAVQPAYVMSSNLIGTNVYNKQNESLGQIRDLVIDSNKVTGVVVNVGGFLGLGESYVVIDPSTVVLAQSAGVWKAFIETTKDNLKTAPKFTYSKKPA